MSRPSLPWRGTRSARAAALGLERGDVVSVYHQVLGRAPREEEIAHQQATMESLDALLRVVLDSEEYEALLRERVLRGGALDEAFFNAYHPDLAPWGVPAGTRSEDGVAIVGHEGWLFLYGGSNDLVRQYAGAYELAPDWLQRWRRLIDHRLESARDLGIDLAMLMLPDKLAVYERHFPEPIERLGPSPVARLVAETGAQILYPRDELSAAVAAGEDVFLRTDSHFNFNGSALLAKRTLGALGAPVPADLTEVELRTYPVAGDLGVRFDPRLVGLYTVPATLGQARIVEDNRAQIDAVGGHLGTRRVFVNDSAPDQRVLVVFGGSSSFAGPGYVGLCWFYAQVFREVHFIWFPFGWDTDYLRRVGAEAVVISGGDRLVVRIPREDVDTAALAADTLGRGQPVSVERILS